MRKFWTLVSIPALLLVLTMGAANAASGGISSSDPGDDPAGLGRRVVGAGVLRGVADEDSITAAFNCSAASVGDAASTTIVNSQSTVHAPPGYNGCWVEQYQPTDTGGRKWVPIADAPGRGMPGNASTTAERVDVSLNGSLRVCWEVVSAYFDGFVPRTSDCGVAVVPTELISSGS